VVKAHKPFCVCVISGFWREVDEIYVVLGYYADLSVCVYGPGSVIGIATAYGLDGRGIESRWWGEIFRTCSDRP
jgi:hypothetical protein